MISLEDCYLIDGAICDIEQNLNAWAVWSVGRHSRTQGLLSWNNNNTISWQTED